MKRNNIGAALIITAIFALGAWRADAMASSLPGPGGQSGILAPAASPYALLAPVTITRDPNEGRAAFQGRPSTCRSGEIKVATDFGWRCRPDR
jgi:hypothetical protein